MHEHYQVEKIGTDENSKIPCLHKDEHMDGTDQGPEFGLPIGYTLKGHIIKEVKKGGYFELVRYERNGVRSLGLTSSSMIKKIEKSAGNVMMVHTKNSIYRFTPLQEDEHQENSN